MDFTHHPDYTCLAQAIAFRSEQRQIERYGFVFVKKDDERMKDAVRRGIQLALDSRKSRGIDSGRLHVEVCDDGVSGRVIDHVPVDERGDVREVEPPTGELPPEYEYSHPFLSEDKEGDEEDGSYNDS